MLLLNKRAMEESIDKQKTIEIIEKTYGNLFTEEYIMPNRITVDFGADHLLYMPCIMNDYFSTKMITSFPDNPSKGVPLLNGILTLNDRETGKVLSIMDANHLTATRTGAVGAVGVKYISKESDRNLGIIGAGKQGFHQALMCSQVHNFDNIFFYDKFGVKEEFIDALKEDLPSQNINVKILDDNISLVKKSDIVISATTSLTPVLPDDQDLLKGKSYISIGSYRPDMREWPDSLFKIADQIYVEEDFAFIETGDLVYPLEAGLRKKEDFKYISDIIGKPQNNDGKTICFKSVGIGFLDLMIAKSIYKTALEKNTGTLIDF